MKLLEQMILKRFALNEKPIEREGPLRHVGAFVAEPLGASMPSALEQLVGADITAIPDAIRYIRRVRRPERCEHLIGLAALERRARIVCAID